MIQFTEKGIKDITFGNKQVEKVMLGEEQVWPTNDSSITSIITIDQSIADPYSRVSGEFGKDGTPETNVVSWIRANSHRYVGNYDAERGMILRQLDDNNSTKYADGSDASEDIKGTNGGDVFMKMPTFWFRGKSLDDTNDKYNIYITKEEPTDGKTWVKWDGNTLIGVYKAVAKDTGNNDNGELYSMSGVTPTRDISQINFKAKARNRSNDGDHFMITTYEAHQVIALLYILYYGNTSSQNTIGAGTQSYPKVTGQTNVDGMNDTKAQNSRSINFWGLENWWGDIYEFIDNLITKNDFSGSGVLSILDYNGNEMRSFSGCSTNSSYISNMMFGEVLDFVGRVAKGSAYSYYCDAGYVNSSANCIAVRSDYANVITGGLFCLTINDSPSYSSYICSSRLLYHGRVTIDNSSNVLKTRNIVIPSWKPIDLQYVYHDNIPVLRTGFEFHICNISNYSQLGKIKLYGLNINYEEIEGVICDKDGNVHLPYFSNIDNKISFDLNYKDKLIGTIVIHNTTEEEVIEENKNE